MKLFLKIISGLFILLSVVIVGALITVGYTSDCEPASEYYQGQSTSAVEQMTAVQARCYGSADVLELAQLDKPEPQADQVLVKIKAAGVNPLDWHYMRGSPYLMRLMSGIGSPNRTAVGVDFAGIVEAVGPKVTKFEVGDRVFGGRDGALGQYLVIGQDRSIAKIPDGVNYEQAAAVPIAAATAIQALRDHGQLVSGQKVLINGASGGVGTYAVQIAKAYGAEVTGVCSTRNVELVKSIGADHVFDYKKENYTVSGQKFDLIVDNVGNHSPFDNEKVLHPNGRLVQVGAPKGDWIGPFLGSIKAAVFSPLVEPEFVNMLAEINQKELQALADMMADGRMRSVIDRRYALADVAQAIRYSESGRARGKIIVNID